MVGTRPGQLTTPAAVAERLPEWVTLVRAPNPGPMTLDGTNTWLLRGPGAPVSVIVDPGPADEGHLERVAAGGPAAVIVLTHGHLDHTEGARRLAARLGGVPVRAADPAHCHGGAPLVPDEALDVDAAGLDVRVLAAPGHTRDSVCLVVTGAGERAVLTGDTVLGRGSAVVAWPDGDLGDYLDSLHRLAAYAGVVALPGHGPALADCAAAARAYLAHRRARLAEVRAALAAGAGGPADVVAAVYPGLDPALRPAAEWSVRAQLAYLARESATAAEAPSAPPPVPGAGAAAAPESVAPRRGSAAPPRESSAGRRRLDAP